MFQQALKGLGTIRCVAVAVSHDLLVFFDKVYKAHTTATVAGLSGGAVAKDICSVQVCFIDRVWGESAQIHKKTCVTSVLCWAPINVLGVVEGMCSIRKQVTSRLACTNLITSRSGC